MRGWEQSSGPSNLTRVFSVETGNRFYSDLQSGNFNAISDETLTTFNVQNASSLRLSVTSNPVEFGGFDRAVRSAFPRRAVLVETP